LEKILDSFVKYIYPREIIQCPSKPRVKDSLTTLYSITTFLTPIHCIIQYLTMNQFLPYLSRSERSPSDQGIPFVLYRHALFLPDSVAATPARKEFRSMYYIQAKATPRFIKAVHLKCPSQNLPIHPSSLLAFREIHSFKFFKNQEIEFNLLR